MSPFQGFWFLWGRSPGPDGPGYQMLAFRACGRTVSGFKFKVSGYAFAARRVIRTWRS
jgi:hypothetical protein